MRQFSFPPFLSLSLSPARTRVIENHRLTVKSFYRYGSNVKLLQVFPKKKKPPRLDPVKVRAAFKATESDDELRNIDVIMRMGKMSQPAVLEWLFNHNCCPDEFKEKIQTPEGWLAERERERVREPERESEREPERESERKCELRHCERDLPGANRCSHSRHS